MKSPWSESRMREIRTSGLMSGGVETDPYGHRATPRLYQIYTDKAPQAPTEL